MPRGRPPKPEDRRQRTHEREVLPAVPETESPAADVAQEDNELAIPEAPQGLLKQTRAQWVELWSSQLAQTIAATDMPALERLFTLYDERHRAMRDFRKARLVRGSTGQPVLNPMGKLVKDLDGEIRQLEDRFGLSPQARLRLGIDLGKAADSLDALNARYRAAEGAQAGNADPGEIEGELVDDDDDPRL